MPVQIPAPSLEGSLLEGKSGHLSSRTGKRAWGEGRSLASPQVVRSFGGTAGHRQAGQRPLRNKCLIFSPR